MGWERRGEKGWFHCEQPLKLGSHFVIKFVLINAHRTTKTWHPLKCHYIAHIHTHIHTHTHIYVYMYI